MSKYENKLLSILILKYSIFVSCTHILQNGQINQCPTHKIIHFATHILFLYYVCKVQLAGVKSWYSCFSTYKIKIWKRVHSIICFIIHVIFMLLHYEFNVAFQTFSMKMVSKTSTCLYLGYYDSTWKLKINYMSINLSLIDLQYFVTQIFVA
jgi:hypothetical protein